MAKRDTHTDSYPEATESESKVWALVSLGAGLAAAAVAKRGLDTSWRLVTGKQPPNNLSDPNLATRDAVMWAMLSGAVVAVIKMLTNRRATNYFVKSTGHLPGQSAEATKA